MKKWFPLFITIALGGVSAASPEITQAIVNHPNLATGLATSIAVIKGLLPSPLQPKQ